MKNKYIFTKFHYNIYSSVIKYNYKHLPLMEIEFAGQNESSYEVSVIHNTGGEGHYLRRPIIVKLGMRTKFGVFHLVNISTLKIILNLEQTTRKSEVIRIFY